MPLQLYDTRTRQKRPFIPHDPARVTMYVCGPTVYDYAHIGNMRPPIAFDVLNRLLRHLFGEGHVVYARNITDVDDKIIDKARETGESVSTITARYTRIYREECQALGVRMPDLEPHATDYIDQMIAMMVELEERGHAYRGETSLWFDVTSLPSYGSVSGRSLDEMQAGARVETLAEKRHPGDFALWKFAKPGEPDATIWDSPWGRGRPGWHSECVAMIHALLGSQIDIHGGGVDLIFPHHENETAQSECLHAEPFVNFWMHNGFLDMGTEKMSKSVGNIQRPTDLLKDWPGEVIRYAMLSAHYRAPLDWTPGLLQQARDTLNGIYGALRRVWGDGEVSPAAPRATIVTALEDDLNTPEALAALCRLAGEANRAVDAGRDQGDLNHLRDELVASGALLGLLASTPLSWEQGADRDDNDRVDALVEARLAARKARDFAEADRIRDALAAEGIEVMDGPSGSTWRRV